MHPSKYSNNAGKSLQYKKYKHEINLEDIHFPMTQTQLPQFEKINPRLGINVITYDNHVFFPVYASANKETAEHKVSLFLFQEHYYLIKNLSALLHSTLQNRKQNHFCFYCLCSYKSKELLSEHERLCRHNLQRQVLPNQEKDQKISFKKFHHTVKLPFCIYWDLEATLQKSPPHTQQKSNENIIHTHHPISICAFRVCINDKYTSEPVLFTGTDCVKRFLRYIEEQSWEIQTLLQNHKHHIKWSKSDEIYYKNTHSCEMCGVKFDGTSKKCRDHCHISYHFNKKENTKSNSRFILCNRCNLTYGKQSTKLAVISHNFRGYDQQFLIRHLKNIGDVHIIPKNTEQFTAIYLKHVNVAFIDSYAFLNTSLSNLIEIFTAEGTKMLDKRYLKHITTKSKLLKLLHQKGVFPYEALKDKTVLRQRYLPKREEFFDSLTQKHISDTDYQHATHVFDSFKCKTFRDYLEIYVKSDVLFLAAIFEQYRKTYYHHHTLDVLHYVSGPSLAFDSMLKMCKVKLDVLPSIDMYNFFQSSVRGGVAGTCLRYAKANNSSCSKHNKEKPSTHIVALDINALYSGSLKQSLPEKNFKWMTKTELKEFNVLDVEDDGPVGYTLDVCLSYPTELHSSHKDLPLCPIKRKIAPHEWSPYTLGIANKFQMKHKPGAEKLVLTLNDKHRYILHFTTLQLCLRLGMKLKQIHRGISYNQRPWMKKFITHNINLRKKAKTTFESNLHKLSNNAVFGVTLTNIFRQTNYQLVDSPKKFKKLAAKPTFQSCKVITNNLVGVQMKKEQLLCSKPIYSGTTCLDISKNLFYRIYYDFLQPYYGVEHCQLIYTDTDSYYILCETEDVCKDFQQNEKWFDFSNYPKESPMYSEKQKRVPGLLKNVYPGMHIEEICALRSKLYAVKLLDGSMDVKAKGVKRSVIKSLSLTDFKKCLFNATQRRHTMHNIVRRNHILTTRKQSKITLSAFEDKRYWFNDGITSLPYGHVCLRKRNANTELQSDIPSKKMKKNEQCMSCSV
jgi:hypothetical protein